MSISRRSFFKGGVISAFVVGIPKWALGQGRTVQTRTVHPPVKVSPKEPSTETPDLYSMAMFAPFLNTEFFIQGSNNQHIPLMLTGVVDLRDPVRDSSAIAAGKECFALEFQSSPAYQ